MPLTGISTRGSGPITEIRLRLDPPHGYDFRPPAKEALSERAGKVPVRQLVLRLPGRGNGRASPRIPEGRRQSRGPAATLEDHRRKWGGRPAHHAGRLSQGSHSYRGERADHPRPARHVLGELTRFLRGGAVALVGLV